LRTAVLRSTQFRRRKSRNAARDQSLQALRTFWQGHKFERDDRLPRWNGWHAARRGLGTNLYRLGVPDKVIQAILRHSNVSVTLGYYVKPQSEDVIAAMNRFEAEMAAHNLRDSDRTVNPTLGTMPKSVN